VTLSFFTCSEQYDCSATYANSQTVKKVYFALLYPHIQYCITSRGCATKFVLDPVVKHLKRMVLIMTRASFCCSKKV